MNKIRTGDEVIVITGRDKGKRGTVSFPVEWGSYRLEVTEEAHVAAARRGQAADDPTDAGDSPAEPQQEEGTGADQDAAEQRREDG